MTHEHQCTNCKHIWKHDNKNAQSQKDEYEMHNCPGCGLQHDGTMFFRDEETRIKTLFARRVRHAAYIYKYGNFFGTMLFAQDNSELDLAAIPATIPLETMRDIIDNVSSEEMAFDMFLDEMLDGMMGEDNDGKTGLEIAH